MKKLSDTKIGTRLMIGFTTILMLVALLGAVSYYQGVKLWKNTDDLYSHPFMVARAIRDIKADVLIMKICVRDMIISDSANEIQNRKKEYANREFNLNENIKVIDRLYLGPKQDIDSIKLSLNSWKATTDETLSHVTNEVNISLLKNMMNGVEGQQFDNLLKHIETVQIFSKDKADHFYTNAAAEKSKLFIRLFIILILILLLTLITGYLIIRSVREPLKELTLVAEDFKSGNYHARSNYISKNEIGSLAASFNNMANNIQIEMNIKKNTAEISEVMIDKNELQPFCKNVLIRLLEITEAQVGAAYAVGKSGLFFEHIESIGMHKDNIKSFSVESAEGQFGVVLSTKKMHLIKDISADSVFTFPTLSGTFMPKEIITIPIIDDNKVVAVVSLASINKFSETSIRFLNEIIINLTARFMGVVSFQKISDFSKKLEENNIELELNREKLAKANAYNRSLIEANIDPLVTIGADGKITDVNKSTELVTGLSREQLIGTSFSDYFTEPEIAKAGYQKVFNDGFVKDYELFLKNINGKITPVLYNASVYRDEKGNVTGVFAAARDITELKAAELKLQEQNATLQAQSEELQSQTEELQTQSEELRTTSEELQEQNVRLAAKSIEVEEANRLKSEFLSNMSHELRTPLNSIMALSNVLIQRSKTKLSEEENSYLEIIERNGRNLLRLINDILDLSKIEAGKVDISVNQVNIENLLEVIYENLQPLSAKKGLEFNIVKETNLPMIETDEERLQQVLTNIIGNAVKFTEKGNVTIYAESDNENINLKVKDSGIGIPKSDIPHIFDKFRQVDGSSSRNYEGTGLGLSIVFELVNIIGGKINVESEIGKGSVFTVSVPIKWKGEMISKITENFHPAEIISERKTILVVDDDLDAVNEIRSFLEEIGYNTIGTTMATDVIRLAEKYRPFAITLDVIMPDLDGWEVLQRLKKNKLTQDIDVIMVSVSSDKETGLALGAVGHITKPVDKEILIKEIKRLHNNPYKIMIVDDNEIDLQFTGNILSKEGLKVIKAQGGKQCIELISTEKPDIIILDLMMPDTDGFQVLNHLRNNPDTKETPVIIATAKDLTSDDKLNLSGKVSSILHKNNTATHEVLKEIERTILKLEQQYSSGDIKNKNILIVEDNEEAIIQIKIVLENAGYIVDTALGGEQAIQHIKNKKTDGIILDLMMPEVDGYQVLEYMQSEKSTAEIPVLILSAKDLPNDDLQKLKYKNVQQLVQKGAIDVKNLLHKIQTMIFKTNTPNLSDLNKNKTRKKAATENHKNKLLIIEDNPDNMITIKAILNDNYIISEAYDGIEGLNKSITEMPDIILLDLALPKMNGFEVLEEIRKNPQTENIIVFAVTAKAMKHDFAAIEKAGFDGYITKPIDANTLLTKIKEMLF